VIGFLLRGPWRLRLCLTLPSGVLWVFVGLVLPVVALTGLLSLAPKVLYFAVPLATAPLFLLAGVLTIEAAFAWLRRN
jgi:hypothetical protein